MFGMLLLVVVVGGGGGGGGGGVFLLTFSCVYIYIYIQFPCSVFKMCAS